MPVLLITRVPTPNPQLHKTSSPHKISITLLTKDQSVERRVTMDSDLATNDNHEQQQIPPTFPSPLILCTKLVSFQAELFSICIVSLASPFLSIISLVSNFFFRRLLLGLLAAAYVFIVLMMVMAAAAVLGVGLVRMWVEEPVSLRESLQLDYTAAHPTAVVSLGKTGGVPVGQTLYVSLLLVMPESDHNIDTGMFQLRAELISVEGELVAKSSQPYMLQFRSWPIRLMRTFAMSMPLLLGIASETQSTVFPILKHKETNYPRTDQVRITLFPQAGTSSLPQVYDAQLVIMSRLPWTKGLVYRWKWTFYIWTTLYIFIGFVMVLVVFLKPLIFPAIASSLPKVEHESSSSSVQLAGQEPVATKREEREVSESLRRWQRSRNKRKAALLHGVMAERTDSSASASSITCSRGPNTPNFEEGSGDSESACFG